MKKFLSILLAIAVVTPLATAQLMYPCDSIPGFLRPGAKAVIRSEQQKIIVKSEKQSDVEYKTAITLLNDEAEDLLLIEIPYDDLMQVSDVSASAWDESGKLIWNLQKYNIRDMRDFQGSKNLSDSRKKAFEIPSYNYPFTISFSYKLKMPNYYLSSAMFLRMIRKFQFNSLEYNVSSHMD